MHAHVRLQVVQVSPLRGHFTFVGNSWTTALTVQLYAMCIGAVFAENVLVRGLPCSSHIHIHRLCCTDAFSVNTRTIVS